MDAALIAVAVGGGGALVGWWVLRVRADLARREGRSVEWQGDAGAGDLWTSAARCPECRATGALLSREPDGLWHTCMACGHRHSRQVRG